LVDGLSRIKPVVLVEPPVEPAEVKSTPVELYPVVVIEPEPSCNCTPDDPDVETPLNITVIRFTPAGIPVKSMLVPEVDATEVIAVMPLAGADHDPSPRKKLDELGEPDASSIATVVLVNGISILLQSKLVGAQPVHRLYRIHL